MSNINIKNNYGTYKIEFRTDTGLDADENVSEYINYFNARMADINQQLLIALTNKVDLMPDTVSSHFSQMFLTHETFIKLTK